MSRLILACFCALLYPCIEAARILAIFPTPSISHQVVFRPLTQELARRGHQVVVVTPDPAFPKGQAPENLTEIDVHDVSYRTWRDLVVSADWDGDINDIDQQVIDALTLFLKTFEDQTTVAEVRDIIENNDFDLLMIEAWLRFALGFSHVVKAPVIAVSSFGGSFDNFDVMGAPSHPLLYHQPVSTRLYNLTRWEKIVQFYKLYSTLKWHKDFEEAENAVVRKIFGEDIPALGELQNNIDMLFLNTYPIWDENRPVPPSVIYIGGIHQNPEKKLPEDLTKYLDSSKHGVIYLSFGTNFEPSTLPADKIQAMIKVFSQLPYDVLWKWNQDELPGRTKNIRIFKWLPQSDLLRHPNVKLFITQGGLQSIDEAITAGVPMIGIPFLGDQWYNVEKIVHHKLGKKVILADLYEETFKSAILTLIKDESYRDNVARLRSIINDQPMAPLERAVWWTEHTLRHGGARHLRAAAANMPAAEYYELELVVIVLSVVLAVTILVALVIYKSCKLVLGMLRSEKIKRS